ncbi:MAG TPA: hypothetical protein VFP72_05710, partial [Kineosporiaceae bacterium]|nr:hypothetical protein [Kineosporiaceae bacterium]
MGGVGGAAGHRGGDRRAAVVHHGDEQRRLRSQVGADSWSICSATGQQRAFWIPLAAAGVGSLGGLIDLVVRKGRSGVL